MKKLHRKLCILAVIVVYACFSISSLCFAQNGINPITGDANKTTSYIIIAIVCAIAIVAAIIILAIKSKRKKK